MNLTLPELERIWNALDCSLQSIHDQLSFHHDDDQDERDLKWSQESTERLQRKVGRMIDAARQKVSDYE